MAIDFKPKEPKTILKRIDVDKKKFKIPIYSRTHKNKNKYYFKDGICQKSLENQKTQELQTQNQGEPVEVHQ